LVFAGLIIAMWGVAIKVQEKRQKWLYGLISLAEVVMLIAFILEGIQIFL
jgi:hypothetical protein